MSDEINRRYDPMSRDELIAECEKLRAGIDEHRRAVCNNPKEAGRGADEKLWALVPDDVAPALESFDMRASYDAAKGLEASATFRGDAVKEWCVIAVDWFREVGGKSFVTMDMTDPRDGEYYTMTIQRAGGKTPAQEIAELKAQLNESSLTRFAKP